ncbi:MAG: large subunit ribosomal protein L21 [Myxococcota bacterium]|jgi:large subunit ribosomal protein L21
MYAVFASGGKQHRVSSGDKLKLEKLAGNEGEDITFDEVLLVSAEGNVNVGAPTVSGATVSGRIVQHGKGRKIIVSTYKRRKGISRTLGHRQHYTLVEITGINAG